MTVGSLSCIKKCMIFPKVNMNLGVIIAGTIVEIYMLAPTYLIIVYY